MMILLTKSLGGLASRWRNFYYGCLGVRLDGYVWMRQIEIPRNYADIWLEASCALDRGVTLIAGGEPFEKAKIEIASHTYINRNTIIDAIDLVRIGRDCAIGPNCYITDHDHGLDSRFAPLQQPMIARKTIIGDRVWLGANVTVLKGVQIGHDAVIGAGSVVTKNIPEQAIAVGIPAKVVRVKNNFHSHTPIS
ncbi:MAG: acyltransferase [Cyanobacteria bacterium J06623_7]